MSAHFTTVQHYDPYKEELGAGEPVYDAWVIEDDQAGASLQDELIKGKQHAFKTPQGRSSTNELWRFRRRGCQDCWALVFFLGLFLVLLMWGVVEIHTLELSQSAFDRISDSMGGARISIEDYGTPIKDKSKKMDKNQPQNPAGNYNEYTLKSFSAVHAGLKIINPPSSHEEAAILSYGYHILFIVFVVFALVGAMLGLMLIESMPRTLITAECFLQCIVFAVSGILTIGSGGILFGVFLLALALVPILFLHLAQDRMAFSVAMLSCTAKILRRHKGLVVLALLMATFSVVFSLFLIFLLLPPVLRAFAGESNASDGGYILLMIFGVFWFQEVVRNVMHVTASGVVATWYFAGESRLPPSPIKASFTRAITNSIGSICFGSLLVAVVRFLRWLVEAARSSEGNDTNLLTCCLDCLFSLVEGLLQYFNQYAFVHIAIYGCSYIEAAKKTWALAKECFIAAIFNDCLAGMAADFLTLAIALCVGITAGVLTWCASFGVIMFIVSLFINVTSFQIVQSAVTTIFVCFAEVPDALAVSFPSLYTVVITTDRGYTGHSHQQPDNYGTV